MREGNFPKGKIGRWYGGEGDGGLKTHPMAGGEGAPRADGGIFCGQKTSSPPVTKSRGFMRGLRPEWMGVAVDLLRAKDHLATSHKKSGLFVA
jgi:hypothetical protein